MSLIVSAIEPSFQETPNMKRFLAAASALAFVAVASQASAADLAARSAPAYTKAPEYVQQVFNWTGFYVGGSLGARTSDVNWTSVSTTDGFPIDGPGNSASLGNTSARVGVYLGYNRQVSSLVVLGLEGDAAWANNDVTHGGFPEGNFSTDPTTDTIRVKLGWDGSIRGRLGFLVTPNVLVYGTGGAAWQQVATTSSCGAASNASFCNVGSFIGNTSATRMGWTVGGGIEAMIMPHVALRGEYRFSDFGHFANTLPPAPNLGINSDVRVRTNIATVGVAYKF
jgi:outer membrane immunogenic protein